MTGLPSFGWLQVLRLALVQACLGSVVVIIIVLLLMGRL